MTGFQRAFHILTLAGYTLAASTTRPVDPCAKIGGLSFAAPADVIACQKAFPFNETLRQNVLAVVSRVFDFYTFEDFYLNSPPPFQESTNNIRTSLARINSAKYQASISRYLPMILLLTMVLQTDYDFNIDLWNFTTQLNDGHTRK